MAKLQVDLVSPEREVWSGDADMVIAKTASGEVGIMPNHAPLLSYLVEGGVVRVQDENRRELVAAVHGGFISMANNQVSILAEAAELGEEVDVAEARDALERARETIDRSEEAVVEERKQRARLRAAGAEVQGLRQ